MSDDHEWGDEREWRNGRTVEHQVRPRGHIPRGWIAAMIGSRAGVVMSWCGLDITDAPASDDHGERRPCARCLASEYAADD